MDNFDKEILKSFINSINDFIIDDNLQFKISELYNKFEASDLDLIYLNNKTELNKDFEELINFYYDNIENCINYFSKEYCKNFIIDIKNKLEKSINSGLLKVINN